MCFHYLEFGNNSQYHLWGRKACLRRLHIDFLRWVKGTRIWTLKTQRTNTTHGSHKRRVVLGLDLLGLFPKRVRLMLRSLPSRTKWAAWIRTYLGYYMSCIRLVLVWKSMRIKWFDIWGRGKLRWKSTRESQNPTLRDQKKRGPIEKIIQEIKEKITIVRPTGSDNSNLLPAIWVIQEGIWV